MRFNMPPGFGTRKGDREYFEDADPEMDEQEDIPVPDPEEWRDGRERNESVESCEDAQRSANGSHLRPL